MTKKTAKPPKAGKPTDEQKAVRRAQRRAKKDAIAKAEQVAIATAEAAPTTDTKARDRKIYDRLMAEAICDLIANGMTMRGACEQIGVNRSTFLTWTMDDLDGLAARYARAREIGIHVMVDDMTDIADDGSNDWMEIETERGNVKTIANHEHIQRSKLRVDHRRWVAAKVLPALYGERVQVDYNKKPLEQLTEEEINAAILKVVNDLGGEEGFSVLTGGKGPPSRPQ